MNNWQIVARPEGQNDGGRNTGGMVVYLQNGSTKEEIGRVAFERANSLHPEVEFKDQLAVELGKAADAVQVLNKLSENAGELQ